VERQDNNQVVFMEIVLDIGLYPAHNEKKERRTALYIFSIGIAF
jgi:hypothetical protein